MAHNIRVQDNDVVFKSTDPDEDISLSVHGEVTIGKGTTTDVISAMNGANLLISTTDGGHLVVSTLSEQSNGILEINNIQWPANFSELKDGATMFVDFDATDGQFKLKYRKMSLGTLSSSSITPDALNSLFPQAKPGQFILAPNYLFLNSDKDTWYSVPASIIPETGELPVPGTGSGSVTSVDVIGGPTGLTTSGGPITESGTISLGGVLSVSHGGTGATTDVGARSALGVQEVLVSGVNVRTVNGVSILGSGNIAIPAGSGGTVTSVNFLGGTTGLTTTGGPITSSGTITLAGTLSVANGGTGATTASAARTALDAQQTLVSGSSIKTINGTSVLGSGDVSIPAVTSVNFLGGSTGLTTSGGPITTSGTITLGGVLSLSNGGTGATTALAARTALDAQQTLVSGTNIKTVNGVSLLGSGNIPIASGGGGTVSSVGVSGGTTGLTTTGGPITSSGTITFAGTLSVANGGTGATTPGGALSALGAQPQLVSGTSIKTINGTSVLGSGNITVGGVTSVGISGGSTGLTTSGGPITTSGTITLAGTLSVANGGTGSTSAISARTALGAQATLISGTNLKSINGTSLLGSGDIQISVPSGLTSGTSGTGFVNYSGLSSVSGQWNGSTLMSSSLVGLVPLTYSGNLRATKVTAGNMLVYSTVWPTVALGHTDNPSAYAVFNYNSGNSEIGSVGAGGSTRIIAGGTPYASNTVMQADSNQAVFYKPIVALSGVTNTSDAKYKDQVEPITGCVEIIQSLRPVSFMWKTDTAHSFPTSRTPGFIAQEISSALKDTVYHDAIVKTNKVALPDGTIETFMGISEGNIVPILTAVIQDLLERVSVLESRINT